MSAYTEIMKQQGKTTGQQVKRPDRHADRPTYVPQGTPYGMAAPIGMKADGKKFGKRKK